MSNSIRILSTKTLSSAQKELLLNADMALVEKDFIRIDPLQVPIPKKIENAIFTSRNAVKAVLPTEPEITNCFCVGDKTEAALVKGMQKVLEKAYKAKALAEIIVADYKEQDFTFFSGNKRREELPSLLLEHGVNLQEIQVYSTTLLPEPVTTGFDAVLFFSPSAVESFAQRNLFEDFTAFCIGKTTEQELKKHTNNIITANRTSIENVIVQVVKHFKQKEF